MDPVEPSRRLTLDVERLAQFPEGYRHLAYLQIEDRLHGEGRTCRACAARPSRRSTPKDALARGSEPGCRVMQDRNAKRLAPDAFRVIAFCLCELQLRRWTPEARSLRRLRHRPRLHEPVARLRHAAGARRRRGASCTRARLGYTHVDTAALYGFGANETLIGRMLKDRRSEFVLASKGGMFRNAQGQREIDGRPEIDHGSTATRA